MLFSDYILIGFVYVVFVLGFYAVTAEEDSLTEYDRFGMGILWPLFLIKFVFVVIGVILKCAFSLMRKAHRWTVIPMAIYKTFKSGGKILVRKWT